MTFVPEICFNPHKILHILKKKGPLCKFTTDCLCKNIHPETQHKADLQNCTLPIYRDLQTHLSWILPVLKNIVEYWRSALLPEIAKKCLLTTNVTASTSLFLLNSNTFSESIYYQPQITRSVHLTSPSAWAVTIETIMYEDVCIKGAVIGSEERLKIFELGIWRNAHLVPVLLQKLRPQIHRCTLPGQRRKQQHSHLLDPSPSSCPTVWEAELHLQMLMSRVARSEALSSFFFYYYSRQLQSNCWKNQDVDFESKGNSSSTEWHQI